MDPHERWLKVLAETVWTEEFLEKSLVAMALPCNTCGAKPGESCVKTVISKTGQSVRMYMSPDFHTSRIPTEIRARNHW